MLIEVAAEPSAPNGTRVNTVLDVCSVVDAAQRLCYHTTDARRWANAVAPAIT
jgi:hypothetical protein